MPYFKTKDACKIFYTTYGVEASNPVVIFLNGATQTTLYWAGLVPAFSRRFGLLCYDARAQGQSDLGNKPISLKQHVSDLKDLLAYLAVDKAHLVGISHGAWVALAFSAEFPEMVDHLVLCSLGAKTNDRSRTIIRSWLEILRLSGLEAMAWAALPTVFGNSFLNQHQKILDKIVDAVVLRNRRRSLIAQLEAVLGYPAPDSMTENLNQPALVISGAEDPIIDPGDVRQLADLCKARHEELPGTGHSIPAERPRVFEKMVLEFLMTGKDGIQMADDTTSHTNMIRQNADFVFKNGMVYTVDKDRSRAESIAVSGKKIVYIGSNAGVTDFIDKNTNVIDLKGKMVLPGFIDSHAHVSFGVSLIATAQLFNLPSLDDCQRSIHDFADKHPDLDVIYGSGWNNELFPPTGPRKENIDVVLSDRPASMMSSDGHAIWVNSAALKTAGITKDTTNPEGGVIERDPETGEPSGTLRENAMDLIHNLLPPFTVEQLKEGILAYADTAAKEGITTVHDPMLILPNETATLLGAGLLRNNIAAFSQLAAENRLSLRVRGSLLAAPEKGSSQLPAFIAERKKQKDPFFQTYSIKIFVDGVIEGSTGYLLEPYEHMPEFRGTFLWDVEVLKESFKVFDKENFQIHVHAIGDAATRITLDAFEYARNANGDRDSRHQITHLQLVDAEDIPRFAALDVIGIPQPIWHLKGEYYAKLSLPYLGRERADRQYPMKSFINAGVKMASASDFPVTVPCPPLLGIMIGTTRCEPEIIGSDEVLWPEECMSLDEMIASFTINGAYANFLEEDTGSLEVGKAADLVVLDRNLFEIPATEINNAKVLLTLFEGKEVYRDHSF